MATVAERKAALKLAQKKNRDALKARHKADLDALKNQWDGWNTDSESAYKIDVGNYNSRKKAALAQFKLELAKIKNDRKIQKSKASETEKREISTLKAAQDLEEKKMIAQHANELAAIK